MTIDACLTLLGIKGKPTRAAVKKAFRQAALKHHPDKRGTDTEFIRIKTAYDTLMALSAEELAKYEALETPPPSGHYDPFIDSDYNIRTFFEPDNPNVEGFERKLRARGCPHCGGYGFVTKNTDPAKGFMGRERRLCKCQWV
jgi:DnaJ-class molecular chaperone